MLYNCKIKGFLISIAAYIGSMLYARMNNSTTLLSKQFTSTVCGGVHEQKEGTKNAHYIIIIHRLWSQIQPNQRWMLFMLFSSYKESHFRRRLYAYRIWKRLHIKDVCIVNILQGNEWNIWNTCCKNRKTNYNTHVNIEVCVPEKMKLLRNIIKENKINYQMITMRNNAFLIAFYNC